MKFSVPPNILYMLFTFLWLDLGAHIQSLTFATLADTLVAMNNHTLITHFGLEPTEARLSLLTSIINSATTAGMLFALFFLMPLSETKGRVFAVIYVRCFLTCGGSLCHLFAAVFESTEFFILGQFIGGCQLPLRAFVTVLYIMECAPDKYRGFTSTALIFSDVIGQVFMYSVASPNVLGKENTWFIFPLIVLITSIIVFCLCLRLPESPKWLVRQNEMEKAAAAVQFYHGKDVDLKEVLDSYVKEKNLTKEEKVSIRQIWENDTLREAFKILISVTLFLGYDSSTVQFVYTIQLHTSSGFTVQDAMNINLILSAILFPAKFIGPYIIDALGRRPVMGIAGVIVFGKSWLMLITQFILYFSGPSLLTKILYFSVEFMTQSVTATGVNSIGILFISELFPPSARTSIAQCLILIAMTINFPVVSTFPIINSFFAPAFFVPYVFTQFFLGVFLYRHMPETRARAVCDIIESMDADVASRRASVLEEHTPLLRNRASTHAIKRNSILNTPRTRALTFDHDLIPNKWNC